MKNFFRDLRAKYWADFYFLFFGNNCKTQYPVPSRQRRRLLDHRWESQLFPRRSLFIPNISWVYFSLCPQHISSISYKEIMKCFHIVVHTVDIATCYIGISKYGMKNNNDNQIILQFYLWSCKLDRFKPLTLSIFYSAAEIDASVSNIVCFLMVGGSVLQSIIGRGKAFTWWAEYVESIDKRHTH